MPKSKIPSVSRSTNQKLSSDAGEARELFTSMSEQLARMHRISDSSSGFVRSMRTASLSNISFSMVPRSSRVGRSTDSYRFHGSQPRYSVESDRPTSSRSFDDAALKHGFRRQQIIDELISTEESYVADLKALVYLYSTLLASTSTIPNKVKLAIEINVTNILLTHETVLARFRETRLRAAARRWAETEIPAHLTLQRRHHLRNSERDTHARHPTSQRRTRSSVDSNDHLALSSYRSRSAEPLDIWDMARVLKVASNDFYLYEEYCANFEVLANELQKQNPHVWPTYESGIESLARVVMAIDHRQAGQRRGLTVGDLLIKPIQRLTKYPLLLEQLLNHTPITDAPSTHLELELVLQSIRGILQTVNLARENPFTRQEIQRRRLLQDRLDLSRLKITEEQFRSLGSISLCGILYITYQSNDNISGCYALCVLLDQHLLIASPVGAVGLFEAMAVIQLSDMRLESPTDGKGIQSASAHFTWKISFACDGRYRELVLSACSKAEEGSWLAGLRGDFSEPLGRSMNPEHLVATSTAFDLKPVGVVFSSEKSLTLSRESSVQRAATLGGRSCISHVIIRNTHNAHDIDESRDSANSMSSINRSQSHMNTKRVPILEPKRSERTRLENRVSDIWTKDRLPFPSMVGSRGGQMIRASAGSLARKLSLASIHTPFSRGRTSSLSMASKNSHDILMESKSGTDTRGCENDNKHKRLTRPKDVPEVDDMRSVVDRMIGVNSTVTKNNARSVQTMPDRHGSRTVHDHLLQGVGPNDPAAVYYKRSAGTANADPDVTDVNGWFESTSIVGVEVTKRRKKRWSKQWPIGKLKEFGSEARSMFQTSSSGG